MSSKSYYVRKFSSTGKRAILIVYVADIIITGNDSELKRLLALEFEIKDMGPSNIFLGWKSLDQKMGLSYLKESIF